MNSVYLDEIKPGMSASMSRTVTERDVELFGEATGDRNPVYRRRGMYQYQSVVLLTEAHAATEAMLRAIASAAHFRRRVGSRAMDAVPCA